METKIMGYFVDCGEIPSRFFVEDQAVELKNGGCNRKTLKWSTLLVVIYNSNLYPCIMTLKHIFVRLH